AATGRSLLKALTGQRTPKKRLKTKSPSPDGLGDFDPQRARCSDSHRLTLLNLVGINQGKDISKSRGADAIVLDLGIERSHFQVKEPGSLYLMTTGLKQRALD